MNNFIWKTTEEESPQGFEYPDPPDAEEFEAQQQPSDRPQPQQAQQQAIAQQQRVDAQRQAATLARLQQMTGGELPRAIALQSQPKRDMLPLYLGGGMIAAFFGLGALAIIANSLPSAQQARQSETIAAIAMEATRHKSNIVCVFDCSAVAEVMQQQNQPAQIQGQHVQVTSGSMDQQLYFKWVEYWAGEAQRLPPEEFNAIAANYQPTSIEDRSAFQFVISSIQQ